jgi:DNA-binding NtrC family response regulator
MIGVDDLPDAVRGAEASRSIELEVGATIGEAEKRMILQTLAYTHGDRTRAAQILGIGRKTLYRKLQQYNAEGIKSD